MKKLAERYNRIQATIDKHKKDLAEAEDELVELEDKAKLYEKARWVLIEAARLTRENFKHEVDDLANLVIKSTFTDRDFEFSLDFYEARGQVECRPVITENNVDYNPKLDMGGSTLDVLGIFFRPILWSLDNDRTRPTFILDEPGRYLDKRIGVVGETLSMISHSLGIQFIITTHNPELAKYGDKSFLVKHDGKNSSVKELETKQVVDYIDGELEEKTNKPNRVRRK